MRKFHQATVVEKRAETNDSVRLRLQVPPEAAADFQYHQGQHLPIRARIGDKNVRRTYSICNSVADNALTLGIRVQPGGVFSNFVADQLNVGDSLEVMPPSGHFYTELDGAQSKIYAAFVAGSGITPILSICKTTLETETNSRFFVFYGNRTRATTMFVEELWALKNTHPERLSLHFVLSQEPSDIELYAGRIDGTKARQLHDAFLARMRPDEIFVCGPNPMIDDISASLIDLGYAPDNIHSERFRAILRDPSKLAKRMTDAPKGGTEVNVLLDGHHRAFHMTGEEASILDAAQAAGLDLPYSCKGGVCSTCRTLLVQGDVDMAVNYALEPWELERGFILACQAQPKSANIELDYDQT